VTQAPKVFCFFFSKNYPTVIWPTLVNENGPTSVGCNALWHCTISAVHRCGAMPKRIAPYGVERQPFKSPFSVENFIITYFTIWLVTLPIVRRAC
jgi:hypothetical protein